MRSSLVIVTIAVSAIASVRGSLSDSEIERVIRSAHRYAMNADDLLQKRRAAGIDLRPEEFLHVEADIFEGSPPRASEISINSRLINHIGFQISMFAGRRPGRGRQAFSAQRANYLDTTLREILGSDVVRNNHPGLACPFQFDGKCENSKYRSLDGSCNNRKHPLRGAALTPFPRDMAPQYGEVPAGEDAYAPPRTLDSEGNDLPSPREISRKVHQTAPKKSKNKNEITLLVVFWGQFMAHMVADRAIASGADGSRINCCKQEHPTPAQECFNIPVATGDPFRALGTSCIGFLRSLETTDINCRNGRREQLNSASSYIDGSAVYGNDHEVADILRTFEGGLMAVSEPDQLPYRKHVNQIAAQSGFVSVAAGDPRAGEVAPLTGMHTIWVREHNRIARGLSAVNPDWSDEKLYQESRRIVVAMIQHVTYNEWLPLIVGNSLYKRYDLKPRPKDEYFTDYSSRVDASTRNEVAAAAFRFGHSIANADYALVNKAFEDTSSPAVTLVEMFFRPNVYAANEQSLMRGLIRDAAPAMDASITSPLTSELFRIEAPHGADLAAFNIQRGRDHGLGPYNAWRKRFSLPELKSFDPEVKFEHIDKDTIGLLGRAYKNPDDVDLWTGGVSETSVPGGILGPLFAKMISLQFADYRRGDRFWYETNEAPQAFTKAQLVEIRKTTFSRVLCDTYDLESIQQRAFQLTRKKSNSLVKCDKLVKKHQIDLKKWKD